MYVMVTKNSFFMQKDKCRKMLPKWPTLFCRIFLTRLRMVHSGCTVVGPYQLVEF